MAQTQILSWQDINPEARLGRWPAARGFAVKHPLATAGAAFILLTVALALAAPWVTTKSATVGDLNAILSGPSAAHWFGTDATGRDVYTRMVYGSRVSIQVGVFAVGLALLIGVPLGLVSAYAGGKVDSAIVVILDAIISFPALILALGLLAALGPGVSRVSLAIGVVSMPVYARVARAEGLSVSQRDFVLAARASGASSWRIVFRHILPNSVSPLIVQATVGVGGAVLAEAGLSFLGVGVRPPQPTWGTILQEGFQFINRTTWLSFVPGMAIFLLVLSFNFLGDALRDELDPRLRGR